jgi:hypothetical protein
MEQILPITLFSKMDAQQSDPQKVYKMGTVVYVTPNWSDPWSDPQKVYRIGTVVYD